MENTSKLLTHTEMATIMRHAEMQRAVHLKKSISSLAISLVKLTKKAISLFSGHSGWFHNDHSAAR